MPRSGPYKVKNRSWSRKTYNKRATRVHAKSMDKATSKQSKLVFLIHESIPANESMTAFKDAAFVISYLFREQSPQCDRRYNALLKRDAIHTDQMLPHLMSHHLMSPTSKDAVLLNENMQRIT